jgi:hypothetical protein
MFIVYFLIDENNSGGIVGTKAEWVPHDKESVWFSFVVLNATFNTISGILWRSVYWWGKPEYPEKTTDLSQVTEEFNKESDLRD